MIHVSLAPEPADFDETVRTPGLSAIAELTGQGQTQKRSGRKRAQLKRKDGTLVTLPQEIPPERFPPFWRKQLPNMLTAYQRICAYLCVYIEPLTGASTIDHMVPKSVAWDRVYEWSNYRLACSVMNAKKGDARDVLDPFEVENGWFQLDLVSFQVVANPALDTPQRTAVVETVKRLGLDDPECRGLRAEYVEQFEEGHISLAYLRRRAPFVAMELERQGRLS